ncbi:MAG: hypothetical protein NC231_12435 [Bacillus sp. (in: Bacteria)]|nr:hypothetical protein [Bacillus sp. (in: firmicutes)]MCM1425422.1 hypothetical protein [Eubacterium sp.]
MKRSLLIFVCSCMLLLCACGSNAEEKAILLEEVTWEDFENSAYTSGENSVPALHFSFSNGSIVNKELPHLELSIVREIAYQDITGNGTDEIIVYREFVNTVKDGYMLMDFFKIEDDTVTEISPSSYITELKDNVWDTEIMDNPTEDYTIALTMKSYGKIRGVSYTDAIMTVGYKENGWEVIRQQKIADWKLAYLTYLLENMLFNDDGNRYWLADIDGDEIPELFVSNNDASFIVSLFSYADGTIEELGDFNGSETVIDQITHQTEYENGMDFDDMWYILGSADDYP